MDNLKEFLLVSSLIDDSEKLEMDLSKLIEKCDFVRLLKENLSKKEEEK